jgi:Sec-independent protein translocase protein TatA
MLTHKYQNWYTELVGLSTWQWYGILAVALLLAGLSVIKPQFFYLLGANTLKQMWRSIKGWFRRSKKTAGEGSAYRRQWFSGRR